MAITSEPLAQTVESAEAHKAEVQVTSAEVAIERIVFDGYEQFLEYKKYLAGLVGENVTLAAKVTHRVAELTGLLVTRSDELLISPTSGQIISVDGSYVTFQCQTGDGTEIHTTFASYLHIHEEPQSD